MTKRSSKHSYIRTPCGITSRVLNLVDKQISVVEQH